MAVATWPATLPTEAGAGWKEDPQSQTVSHAPAAGPRKVRRRTTKEIRHRQIPLQLTGTQMATLRTFFNDTLAGGSLPFDWTSGDPLDGSTPRYRFLKTPAFGHWTPASATANRRYNLTLSLEVI